MKHCSRCKEEKQLSEFGKRSIAKDGLQYHCKDCHNQYNLNYYYSKNKEEHNKRVTNYRQRQVRKYRLWKHVLGCSKCPENHPACIEFHHLEEKKINISRLAKQGMKLTSIQKIVENEGCISICSNCHRKLHFEEE